MNTDYIIYRVIFNNGGEELIKATGLRWTTRDGRLVVELKRVPTEDDKCEVAGIFADTNIVGIIRMDSILLALDLES